jgi:hypothetical protein
MKYPFRFYGREPADWHQSPHGYLYDVQFIKAPDEKTREKLKSLADRVFGDSPAVLGDIWLWGGERFLAFSVKERFDDAARMVFTHVSEFLSAVHQIEKLRDVVFCNGVGSRADRWDAWTLKQAAEPDPGPKRPTEEWGSLLRRPENTELLWEETIKPAAAAPAAPKAAAPMAAPPPPPPPKKRAPKKPITGISTARSALLPPQESEERVLHGWSKIVAAFPTANLQRIEGLKIPVGWSLSRGRKSAVVCLNGAGIPQQIELPEALYDASALAVDPDGIHAVVSAAGQIWSLNLSECTLRWRSTIHANNGAISALAWVVDDLWAIRCVNQLMLFDLSEEDAIYVGTQQPSGSLLGSIRHGTILVVNGAAELFFIGVCDWQCVSLGSLNKRGRTPKIIDDTLYLISKTDQSKGGRVVGLDEGYEAWAAPLRRQAEQDRELRFKSQEKIFWKWIDIKDMPTDRHRERVKELEKRFGEEATFSIEDAGDAIVGIAREGRPRSRGASFVFCSADNKEKALTCNIAWDEGLTNFSLNTAKDAFFFVSGQYFKVCLVDIKQDTTTICHIDNFSYRGGLFYDLIADDRENFTAIWNNTVDWHQLQNGKWVIKSTQTLDMPRGNWYDSDNHRLYIMQQSKERLIAFQWTKNALVKEHSWTDPIKEISLRDKRFFAQMIDGQWFELIGM